MQFLVDVGTLHFLVLALKVYQVSSHLSFRLFTAVPVSVQDPIELFLLLFGYFILVCVNLNFWESLRSQISIFTLIQIIPRFV